MSGNKICWVTGGHHLATTVRRDPEHLEDRVSQCEACHQDIHQFWLDAEEDRTGRWSPWLTRMMVIEENPI